METHTRRNCHLRHGAIGSKQVVLGVRESGRFFDNLESMRKDVLMSTGDKRIKSSSVG